MRSAELKNRLALFRMRSAECGVRSFSAPDVDLLEALKLPPEKAIEYFKSKGFAFSWDWQDVWQQAHSLAFTVAKAMRLDILQTIRDELQTAFDDGMMLRDFQKRLEPKLKELGWWGREELIDKDTGVVTSVQLGSPRRLRTIYETNMRTGYEAGRYREMMESMDDAPYGQYVAVLDAKTRPAHRALNGLVFRLDDPFWNTHWPPLDWGCRCSVRQLSARDVRKRGLVVMSGEGNLTDHEVTMPGGGTATVTTYRDPRTGRTTTTAPGWNYNPGMVDWSPDLGRYDADIAKLF
jgi:SPP1 gp7 family putative phage head morphogenesis protein